MPRKKASPANKKTLKDLNTIIAQHKAVVSEEAKNIIQLELQPVFDKHPEIQGIRWSQCTPLAAGDIEALTPEDFRIEDVEYKLSTYASLKPTPYGDPNLTSGFDKHDDEWMSPWNDRRVENPALLDDITVLEERLFDSENSLIMAFGEQTRVTVTRTDVTLENN